ncbi:hypothetical protein IC218_13615 [Clostridioides sp. ES-S-0005-03]|uniref:hypothetical protein n=1 Tax=Clostridioides sp. ES-S-0005-03 TaxID=2770774 RepID=UPI001D129B2B|nr:hypothetical protein [Clostridioides sp. ES-S-0005-03]UDN48189.1 hypothetical protein JJJ25_03750 [Clostridioides sp. ES-S-0173-01]
MNYYKDKREGFRGYGDFEMRGHHKHQEHHGEDSKYSQHHAQVGYGGPHRHPWNHVCEGCKIFEMMCHEGFAPRGYEGGHGNREYRGHEGFASRGYEGGHGNREYRGHEEFVPRGYEGGHGNRECRGHEGFAPSGHERTYREFKENEEFDAKNYQENNEYQKCGRFENQNVDEKIVSENKSDTEKNNIKEYEKIYESKTATDEQVEEVKKNNTKEEIKGEKKDTDKK